MTEKELLYVYINRALKCIEILKQAAYTWHEHLHRRMLGRRRELAARVKKCTNNVFLKDVMNVMVK
jgi:hypothetical protein